MRPRLIAHRSLLIQTAHRPPLIEDRSPPTAHGSLKTAHRPQPTAHRTRLTAPGSPHPAHRTRLTAHGSSPTAHRTRLSAPGSTHTAHRTWLIAHVFIRWAPATGFLIKATVVSSRWSRRR